MKRTRTKKDSLCHIPVKGFKIMCHLKAVCGPKLMWSGIRSRFHKFWPVKSLRFAKIDLKRREMSTKDIFGDSRPTKTTLCCFRKYPYPHSNLAIQLSSPPQDCQWTSPKRVRKFFGTTLTVWSWVGGGRLLRLKQQPKLSKVKMLYPFLSFLYLSSET